MTKKNHKITSQQFVDLIIGETLTTAEMLERVQKRYPHVGITIEQIRGRLDNLRSSPNAELVKTCATKPFKYLLVSVKPRYFHSYKYNQHQQKFASDHADASESVAFSSPHRQAELQYCQRRQFIDQVLAAAKRRISA